MMKCQYAHAHAITAYECPEATHSVENEDFCPQLTLPFNVQAEEFKILEVGFNFILWDQGEDL